jgi:asparagine synthase (glutamine-hydrolysing)
MCGINGFTFADEKKAYVMNQKLKHRGPDDEGVYVGENISLAMTRLSILDTSTKGHQPMHSHDKRFTIVHNGEIYNFKDVRNELITKGYSFKSESDTEVILAAYQEYRDECVKKFNGMFAFALWDAKEQRLFAARDHAGIKPFYYFFDGKRLIFSSELKSILAHSIPRELDHISLNSFLRFSYINGPATIFKNIYSLLPGHTLTFQKGIVSLDKYWEIPQIVSNATFEVQKTTIRTIFDASVKRQLVSDRPLGIFLGGGIDSTAILGSMAEETKEKIKTFSVRFKTDVQGDKFNEDSDVAKRTSKHYDTEHHELVISGKDVAHHLEDIVTHTDSLTANNSAIAPYLLSKFAKKHVDVVLGGDGGDELFGGYERYFHFLKIQQLQKIPQAVRKNSLASIAFRTAGKSDYYIKLNASLFDLFWMYRAQKEAMIAPMLSKSLRDDAGAQLRYKERFFHGEESNYATKLMTIDFQSWLVDESLTKSDGLTMASGLEQRVPLLDKEMVELAFTIPSQYKIQSRTQGKYIFKEAVKDYLPTEVYMKRKTGWFAPSSKWFRTDMKDLAYEILSPSYTQHTQEFFDFKEIRRLLEDHIEIKKYALNILWSLMVFQVWYRQMLED